MEQDKVLYIDYIMNDVLPNALMIGVDYDLFWELNPKSLAPFIKAFKLKQRYDDAMNWSLGRYFQMAVASNFSKEAKYPPKPYMETVDLETGELIPEQQNMPQDELKHRIMAHVALINQEKIRKEVTNG